METVLKQLKVLAKFIRKDGFIKGLINRNKLLGGVIGGQRQLNVDGYIHPVFFRPKTTDVHLVLSILYAQEYNVELRGIDPKIIVDVGSNTGLTSIYFANKFSDSKVYSYEPEPENYRLLKENCSGYSNIEAFNFAVWGKNTKLFSQRKYADAWSFSLEESVQGGVEQETVIRGITLETIHEQLGGFPIDVLKIDIEGGELSIFSEDCSWLHNVKIIVIELHDRKVKGCSQALYAALIRENIKFTQKNMGYNTVIYNEVYFT